MSKKSSKKSKKTVYVNTQLPTKYKKLAEKAGFALWQGESWAPPNACIDWASVYDKEMKLYTELLIKKCLKVVEDVMLISMNDHIRIQPLLDSIKKDMLRGFDKVKQDGDGSQ